MFGLSDSEEIMTLAFFFLYQSATDRRIDVCCSRGPMQYQRLQLAILYHTGKETRTGFDRLLKTIFDVQMK